MKNELSAETSPYLLQHANNPVHWQSWGDAALAIARESDKPILVSIGYSACHWCHVMEKESFEIDETAALMNEHFINIKIDREERPDIDHIYMDAVQAISGSGGWPLNVFLTPDAKPFYGGTYFPPVNAFNRPSWSNVLLNIADAWKNRRAEIEEQAETLIQHLQKANSFGKIKSVIDIQEGTSGFTKNDWVNITNTLLSNADIEEGGFGKAPKFPQTFSINFLLQSYYFLKNEKALEHAERSLNKMLQGGIYDQLAGGLSRYSTDEEWLAPHFEKMLYDNALFIISLSNAYLLTKKDVYKNAVKDVCNFIFTEMKSNSGGYYAALDADSEGVEGLFYVWDKTETDEILGEDAAFFNKYYDITATGNWEEKNILRVLKPLNVVAEKEGISLNKAEDIIKTGKEKLLSVRNKRVRPGTDDKIILGWNALLLTAFCKAFAVLQNDEYKTAAIELYDFIENNFINNDGGYFHTYKNKTAKYPAFLDDYNYFIEACIHLQEITGDQKYLYIAQEITEYLFENFHDKESDFFFFTGKDQTDIVIRKIELYDGATPSANAVMAKNLLYLSIVFDNREWHQKAISMVDSLKAVIEKNPGSFAVWASTAINITAGINEIAIIGKDVIPSINKMLLEYVPNKIIQSNFNISDMPLFKNRPVSEEIIIYLCREFICKKPVSSVEELVSQLQIQTF